MLGAHVWHAASISTSWRAPSRVGTLPDVLHTPAASSQWQTHRYSRGSSADLATSSTSGGAVSPPDLRPSMPTPATCSWNRVCSMCATLGQREASAGSSTVHRPGCCWANDTWAAPMSSSSPGTVCTASHRGRWWPRPARQSNKW